MQLQKMNSIIKQDKIDMMFDNDESFEHNYQIHIEQNEDQNYSHSSFSNCHQPNESQSKDQYLKANENNIEWEDFERLDYMTKGDDYLAPNIASGLSNSSALRRSS